MHSWTPLWVAIITSSESLASLAGALLLLVCSSRGLWRLQPGSHESAVLFTLANVAAGDAAFAACWLVSMAGLHGPQQLALSNVTLDALAEVGTIGADLGFVTSAVWTAVLAWLLHEALIVRATTISFWRRRWALVLVSWGASATLVVAASLAGDTELHMGVDLGAAQSRPPWPAMQAMLVTLTEVVTPSATILFVLVKYASLRTAYRKHTSLLRDTLSELPPSARTSTCASGAGSGYHPLGSGSSTPYQPCDSVATEASAPSASPRCSRLSDSRATEPGCAHAGHPINVHGEAMAAKLDRRLATYLSAFVLCQARSPRADEH